MPKILPQHRDRLSQTHFAEFLDIHAKTLCEKAADPEIGFVYAPSFRDRAGRPWYRPWQAALISYVESGGSVEIARQEMNALSEMAKNPSTYKSDWTPPRRGRPRREPIAEGAP